MFILNLKKLSFKINYSTKHLYSKCRKNTCNYLVNSFSHKDNRDNFINN